MNPVYAYCLMTVAVYLYDLTKCYHREHTPLRLLLYIPVQSWWTGLHWDHRQACSWGTWTYSSCGVHQSPTETYTHRPTCKHANQDTQKQIDLHANITTYAESWIWESHHRAMKHHPPYGYETENVSVYVRQWHLITLVFEYLINIWLHMGSHFSCHPTQVNAPPTLTPASQHTHAYRVSK